MIESIKSYAGVVALVILAIMGIVFFSKGSSELAGSTACTDITCLQGGLRLTTGPLEVDSGNFTIAGNETLTGNLAVSGTSALTGTTTLGAGLTFSKAPSGIGFFPTSTATRVCIVGSALGATSTFAGTMYFTYGACN